MDRPSARNDRATGARKNLGGTVGSGPQGGAPDAPAGAQGSANATTRQVRPVPDHGIIGYVK